jgi:hypothetical protein
MLCCLSGHTLLNFFSKSVVLVSVMNKARKQNHQPLYEISDALPARPHEIFFSGIGKQDRPVVIYECYR